MKIEIRYAAEYRYAERVTFSPHIFRVIPKVDRYLKVHRFDFRTNRDSVINWRRDIFDNEIASVFYPTPARALHVRFQLKLEIEPKNAFGFLLESRALDLPFAYQPEELRVLAPYLGAEPPPSLGFWSEPTAPRSTVETLVALNEAIHDNLEYERREEGAARPSTETIALGRGACRDFSVLLVDTLRGLGLAARHASGYLCEFGASEKKAEGSLHAWVETYLPGAGWIGLDPTNGTFCDHHHLTAAVGVTTGDITPVDGSYFHSTSVPQEMTSSLEIRSHEHR
ncbi:MAG TPA: transglutaminase family protein [Chthoniobacteraceae bacterium]|nr:transglutaminase family protein [Chthoniobacteraceae bacterium]